jgi:hypothetical protein
MLLVLFRLAVVRYCGVIDSKHQVRNIVLWKIFVMYMLHSRTNWWKRGFDWNDMSIWQAVLQENISWSVSNVRHFGVQNNKSREWNCVNIVFSFDDNCQYFQEILLFSFFLITLFCICL